VSKMWAFSAIQKIRRILPSGWCNENFRLDRDDGEVYQEASFAYFVCLKCESPPYRIRISRVVSKEISGCKACSSRLAGIKKRLPDEQCSLRWRKESGRILTTDEQIQYHTEQTKRHRELSATLHGKAYDLWARASKRAKEKNLSITITKEQIATRLFDGNCCCEVTGVPFDFNSSDKEQSWANPLSPSLDQIIAGDGYTTENVRIVTTFYNRAKSEWTDEEVAAYSTSIPRPKDTTVSHYGTRLRSLAVTNVDIIDEYVSMGRYSVESKVSISKGSVPTVITTPTGEKEWVISVREYCKAHNLDQPNMWCVISGKRKHHKGYKAVRVPLAEIKDGYWNGIEVPDYILEAYGVFSEHKLAA
jgi:hypothetical protein